MPDFKYVVGIDLGTTNSIIAYTKADLSKGETSEIKVLDIPQLVNSGVIEKRSMLPSYIFMPGKHLVSEDGLSLPWADEPSSEIIGIFARERGAEVPQRLVSSSKSWLCHKLIDRNKPVLPWESTEEKIKKISPVEASAIILSHIKKAWDYTMAGEDPKLRLENQYVVLTVPASFDAVARDLTVKAAKMAGLPDLTLLEEPQSAFYAWIQDQGDQWREGVSCGDLVLVCDIGGGTTDFSLIKIDEENGELVLDRIAVGDHLLVGGDNMDLALAYLISNKLAKKKKKIDLWQMRGLSHSCRSIKEKALSDNRSDNNIDEFPVTILGRGSKLIGGTIKAEISTKEIEKIVIDGFFPKCTISDKPEIKHGAGLKELGLSYENDPAVTKHIAGFLSKRKNQDDSVEIPNAILFNGGIMKAESIRQKILDTMNLWNGSPTEKKVKELESGDFDLSVAKGAAYYGLVKLGSGIRIRGGLSKTYYIAIASSMPAVPGISAPVKALCVAPFGMEEGTSARIDKDFVLVVGELVKFDLMGSSLRLDDSIGAVVEEWEEGDIEDITTIETTLDGEPGTVVAVTIEIDITETGVLEFWCVSKEDDKRWKLEFNVRNVDEITSTNRHIDLELDLFDLKTQKQKE